MTNGWGAADVGGAWTISGGPTAFSVSSGAARVLTMPSVGVTGSFTTFTVSDTELRAEVGLDSLPSGSGAYISFQPRTVAKDNFQVRIESTGKVTGLMSTRIAGKETSISTSVSPFNYAVGENILVRTQAQGLSPTKLRLKFWKKGTSEPVAWLQEVTDSEPVLQFAGGFGINFYLSSGASSPVSMTLDNFWAGPATN